AIFAIWFGVRFILGGSEDTWVCTDDGWKKHGAPSEQKPIKLCKNKNIRITKPESGQLITSPLMIEGEARGNWFFEGDAPVILLDADGKGLVSAYISTQEIWVIDKFVDFEGGFDFEMPETETGTLIFKKDNPSGLEENDVEVAIPVRFDLSETPEACQEDCE
ncbi:MAG: Gmad2 immunoglobulin-like domain-containing protein, partial [Patescibacteria group bacterium]|nr:Gmad2 immunoglobulin-like domain-containing protein [Patescibacteria group bacterium]